MSGTKMLTADPKIPVSCEVGPLWISQMLDCIEIWGIQRPGQHLKLVLHLNPITLCQCFHKRVQVTQQTRPLSLIRGPVLMLACALWVFLAVDRGQHGHSN